MGLSYPMHVSKLCTSFKGSLNENSQLSPIFLLSYRLSTMPSRKNCGSTGRRSSVFLLCPEGLTVGALVHGGMILVGTHQDAVQRAVVLGVAVIGAGLNGAFDALVCMAVHKSSSFLFGTALV